MACEISSFVELDLNAGCPHDKKIEIGGGEALPSAELYPRRNPLSGTVSRVHSLANQDHGFQARLNRRHKCSRLRPNLRRGTQAGAYCIPLLRKLFRCEAHCAKHETGSLGVAINSSAEDQTLILCKLMPAIARKHLLLIDPQTCALRNVIESQLITMRMSNVRYSGKLDFLSPLIFRRNLLCQRHKISISFPQKLNIEARRPESLNEVKKIMGVLCLYGSGLYYSGCWLWLNAGPNP